MYVTKRAVSEPAEYWIDNPINVLDNGFVYLVDYMGNDMSIEQAARTSYGPETKSVTSSTGLIRYLMRHRHTSPIEMVELKFHLKMPIFIARQWMRHRTASINEMSGRYSVLPSEFYIPSTNNLNHQSSINNQGRGELLSEQEAQAVTQMLRLDADQAYRHYDEMIRRYDVARETARANLPVSIYTEFYWKIDMHNLLHFLKLRLDSHAQLEIRKYAEAVDQIVADGWPITHSAFSDYVKNAVTFSAPELEALNTLLNDLSQESWDAGLNLSSRERQEFCDKIDKILSSNNKVVKYD